MPPKKSKKKIKAEQSTEELLAVAINSTSASQLRTTLKEICDACPEAKMLAEAKLLLTKDYYDSDELEVINANGKRELPGLRYEVCEQCDKEYDVWVEDQDDDCMWHDGELEIDEEYFADHDEPFHLLDSDQYRKDYPDGFRWSCCDEESEADGCQTDYHTPKLRMKKLKTK